MNFTPRLHPQVEQDYQESYNWYEDKQEGLGKRFLQAVKDKIETIVQNPEVYGSRGNTLYREAKVDRFPYLIIYKINKKKTEVHILSIHHSSRNPTKKYRNK